MRLWKVGKKGLPNIFSFQALNIALYYIVPGVVAVFSHDLVIPTKKRNLGDSLFGLISFSMFNLILYILLAPLINKFIPVLNIANVVSNTPIDYRSTIFISFIIPAVLGYASANIPQTWLFQRFFRGAILNPVPSAWEYVFRQVEKSYFIICHLKTGSKVGGFYSTQSYTSSYPGEQDIYLQEVWEMPDTGPWKKVDRTDGAYIKMKDCSYIEFLTIGPSENPELPVSTRTRLRFQWINKNKSQQPSSQPSQQPE